VAESSRVKFSFVMSRVGFDSHETTNRFVRPTDSNCLACWRLKSYSSDDLWRRGSVIACKAEIDGVFKVLPLLRYSLIAEGEKTKATVLYG
jgi:hypothetical protein